MSAQAKRESSAAPIRVKKRRSPVETDSDEEDIPREPARKFFRPNANATTPAADTNLSSSSNANASTPEISYAKKSSRPSATRSSATTTTVILLPDKKPDQSRCKTTKDKAQEDSNLIDVDSDDEIDFKKCEELLKPACSPPMPPSPLSTPSPAVTRAITTIKTNNNTVETNEKRQLMPSDPDTSNTNNKKDIQDLKHECLTGQLALLIDSHNRFIDTIRHVFGALVNQPNTICRSCSRKLDLTTKDN